MLFLHLVHFGTNALIQKTATNKAIKCIFQKLSNLNHVSMATIKFENVFSVILQQRPSQFYISTIFKVIYNKMGVENALNEKYFLSSI